MSPPFEDVQLLIDHIPDPIFVKDDVHRWVLVNAAFCSLLGRTRGDLLGRTDADIFSADEAAVFYRQDDVAFAQEPAVVENEEVLTNATGERRIIVTKKVVARTSSGSRVLLGIIRDLTEHRHFEERLFEAEKNAALGSMVAGVAHEINTPLGNALMTASALLTLLDRFEAEVAFGALRKSSLLRFVENAREAGQLLVRSHERAARLIRQFKLVAVDQASERRRRFCLREVLEGVVGVCAASLSAKGIHVTTEIASEGPLELDSYPGALEQVLLNLIQNAALHAFSDRPGGLITIRASERASHVEIAVADDGVGMPAEIRRRAFEPFFTTKLGAGGSGLGLTISRNLVRDVLGGDVVVESSAGVGTTFVLDIPNVAPERGGA